MKQRIFTLLVIIPLVLLLAYLLKDYVHKYILAPVFYALRIARILFEALPQSVCWMIFLFILAVVAIRSLLSGRQSTSVEVKSPNEERMSRARSWSRWIEMSRWGNYSKWLLARHFADLVSNVLVYQERLPLAQIRARIMGNEENLPADIWDYLQVGLNAPSFRHYSEFLEDKSWLHFPSRSQLIQYLRYSLRNGSFWRFGGILRKGSTLHDGSSLRDGSTLGDGNTLPTTPLNLDPEVIVEYLETKIPTGGSV